MGFCQREVLRFFYFVTCCLLIMEKHRTTACKPGKCEASAARTGSHALINCVLPVDISKKQVKSFAIRHKNDFLQEVDTPVTCHSTESNYSTVKGIHYVCDVETASGYMFDELNVSCPLKLYIDNVKWHHGGLYWCVLYEHHTGTLSVGENPCRLNVIESPDCDCQGGADCNCHSDSVQAYLPYSTMVIIGLEAFILLVVIGSVFCLFRQFRMMKGGTLKNSESKTPLFEQVNLPDEDGADACADVTSNTISIRDESGLADIKNNEAVTSV